MWPRRARTRRKWEVGAWGKSATPRIAAPGAHPAGAPYGALSPMFRLAGARNPPRRRLHHSNARSQWLGETTPAGVILSTICGSTVDNAIDRSWGVIPTFAASWVIV